jgi:Protein of unknown function (DUF2490)
MRLRALFSVCVGVAQLFLPCFAIPDDLQLWVPVTMEAPVPKLKTMRVSLEIQPRLADNLAKLALVRIRPFVTWQVNSHVSLTAGYLWSPVFQKTTTYENRLWQQIQYHQPIKKTMLTHQLRLDERLLPDGTSVRSRYMLRAVMPLGSSPNWRAVTSNEILVNLNQTPSLPAGLNQNRSFVGLRRLLGKDRFIEGGYLLQYVHKPDALNHVIVLRIQWALTEPKDAFLDDSPY